MTQLLGYDIYRTEHINLSQTPYTIRFSSSTDGQEHVLTVSNDVTNKQAKYRLISGVASDFDNYHNEKLADEVLKIIEDDIKSNRIYGGL